MLETEREKIFMQWDFCNPMRRKQLMAEYLIYHSEYTQESWLNFLKANLESEDNWGKVGQA